MSDYLDSLPTDDYPLEPRETHLFESIVKSNSSLYDFIQDFRDIVLFSILFFILNLDATNEFLKHTITYANSSSVSLLVCKTILFAIGLFFIRNIHLVSK